jgi:hypothetical protein
MDENPTTDSEILSEVCTIAKNIKKCEARLKYTYDESIK